MPGMAFSPLQERVSERVSSFVQLPKQKRRQTSSNADVNTFIDELLEPRRSLKSNEVAVAREHLPAAERQAELQLRTCRALAEAVQSAAHTLTNAGSGLRADQQDSMLNLSLEAEEEPSVAHACNGLMSACGDLGQALLTVASALTGDVLDPLRDLQQGFEGDRDRMRADLQRLEQSETQCLQHLKDSMQRKEKTTSELELRQRDHDQKKGNKAIRWFKKPTVAKAAEKVSNAADARNAAVKEFNAHADSVAAARDQKEAAVAGLHAFFTNVPARRRALLSVSLGRCAVAWGEAAQVMGSAAEHLRGSGVELRCEQVEASRSCARLTNVSSTLTSPQLADIAAAAAAAAVAARPRVPRLPLDYVGQTTPVQNDVDWPSFRVNGEAVEGQTTPVQNVVDWPSFRVNGEAVEGVLPRVAGAEYSKMRVVSCRKHGLKWAEETEGKQPGPRTAANGHDADFDFDFDFDHAPASCLTGSTGAVGNEVSIVLAPTRLAARPSLSPCEQRSSQQAQRVQKERRRHSAPTLDFANANEDPGPLVTTL